MDAKIAKIYGIIQHPDIGSKSGRLTYLGKIKAEKKIGRKQKIFYQVSCTCGRIFWMHRNVFIDGAQSCKPCGNLSHEQSKTRLYRTWASMLSRCYNESQTSYQWYGGKGICVCAEWHDYIIFATWANRNGYTDELTIDRINSDKHYTPDNCRWITIAENVSRTHYKQ